MKLRGVVEHITYQNPENGWSVMKVKVKDYKDLVTLTGSLLDVPVGSVLLCEGNWRVDARYGQQFVVESWEEVMPATIYGIEKYLGSGLVKGISAVDTSERTLSVIYDGRVIEYDVSELDELTLAYAITIHKSQGSEFQVVVMPVTMKHFVMLQRNLIYTGITRAKKICVLVGTTKALAYAIHNQTVSKRNTKLKERLNNK